MFSNYFLINKDFINHFDESQKAILSDFAYNTYVQCLQNKSHRVSKDRFFSSDRVHYSLVYTYCPKCKVKGFVINPLSKKKSEGFKFCPHCGEPNISHRYNIGREKIVSLLTLSKQLSQDNPVLSQRLNQQILVLICSVFEVYLREFYADILNSKFIRSELSMYEKFLDDCKNDFLNPGKTHARLKKELSIDYKGSIGAIAFKTLSLWADYRNVIVHNNGICDRKFIKQHPEIGLRAEVVPTWKQLSSYLYVVDFAVQTLDKEYSKTLLAIVIDELGSKINIEKLKFPIEKTID